MGGTATGKATGNSAGTTNSSNSTGSTALQASGVAGLRSFWAAVIVPAALCSVAMI
jgi:hypothetical protein